MAVLLLLACTPPPDGAPPTLETAALAAELSLQGRSDWPPDDLALDWIQTVWAYGVWVQGGGTDYVREWLELKGGDFDPQSSDSLSPAVVAAAVGGFPEIDEAAEAYLQAAPRVSNGAIAHWGADNHWGMPSDQVWVDSQFMFGLFLLRRYEATGEQAWLDLWTEQYDAFSELCRDPDDQLYRHAWDDAARANIPTEAAYWLRGNGWVLVSAAEALALDPSLDVADDFRAHMEATLALQAADGLWHTVMNSPQGEDPDNYTETSGSALVLYALAMGLKSGALSEGRDPLVAGIDGLQARLLDLGDEWSLVGTSAGTNPGDYAYYTSVPQIDDLMLGYGAVLMALAEADGL